LIFVGVQSLIIASRRKRNRAGFCFRLDAKLSNVPNSEGFLTFLVNTFDWHFGSVKGRSGKQVGDKEAKLDTVQEKRSAQ